MGQVIIKVSKSRKSKRQLPCYEKRKNVLAYAGYGSYPEYLASDQWLELRKRVLKRFGGRCLVCSGHAAQVHHLDYNTNTLLGIAIERLVALCREHHEDIEFKDGKKVSVGEAKNRLFRLAQKAGKRGQRWVKLVKSLEDKRAKAHHEANQRYSRTHRREHRERVQLIHDNALERFIRNDESQGRIVYNFRLKTMK